GPELVRELGRELAADPARVASARRDPSVQRLRVVERDPRSTSPGGGVRGLSFARRHRPTLACHSRRARTNLRKMTTIGGSLAPGLLIAAPPLGDPNFDRTVVLLAMHGDTGALGFVINRIAPVSLGELLGLAGYKEPTVEDGSRDPPSSED